MHVETLCCFFLIDYVMQICFCGEIRNSIDFFKLYIYCGNFGFYDDHRPPLISKPLFILCKFVFRDVRPLFEVVLMSRGNHIVQGVGRIGYCNKGTQVDESYTVFWKWDPWWITQ